MQPDLGHVGLAPHPDLDLAFPRLRLVPGVAAQRIGRREDPPGIVVRDGELRRLPVDIGVRVEIPPHRPLGQCGQHFHVLGVVGHVHVAAPPPNYARPVHSKPPHRGVRPHGYRTRYRWYRELSDPWRHYDPATSQGLHVSLFTLRACAGRLSFRSSRRGSVPLTTLMAWPTSSPPPGNSHRHQTPRRPLWVGPVEGPA